MRVLAPHLLRGLLTGFVFAIASTGASAQAAPPPNPRTVAPDPAVEAARAAFEALPESERKALQDALVWVGDYNGMADGNFGRQTYDALLAFQRRRKGSPHGILDTAARAELRAAGQQARERVGFEIVDDERSGVRIGVPGRLLTKRDLNQSGGTRWQSADDKVTLDTRSVAAPNEGLQSLYDRNLAIRTPGRQVTYKVIRPDFFVIAGETPTGKFHTRYAAKDGILRGFSIGYDKSLSPEADRIVAAIANNFTPFSAQPAAAPAAVATPAPIAEPSTAPPDGLLGTALVIGPHRAITMGIEGCANLRAAGLKPRQVRTAERLTLMEFAEALRPASLHVGSDSTGPDMSLLVVAYARQGSKDELVVAPALAQPDGTISAPLQPGAAGAPVVDRSGALRGLVQHGPVGRRTVAGIVPPARYHLYAAGLADLIGPDQPREAKAPSLSAAEITSALRASIVPVTCGP